MSPLGQAAMLPTSSSEDDDQAVPLPVVRPPACKLGNVSGSQLNWSWRGLPAPPVEVQGGNKVLESTLRPSEKYCAFRENPSISPRSGASKQRPQPPAEERPVSRGRRVPGIGKRHNGEVSDAGAITQPLSARCPREDGGAVASLRDSSIADSGGSRYLPPVPRTARGLSTASASLRESSAPRSAPATGSSSTNAVAPASVTRVASFSAVQHPPEASLSVESTNARQREVHRDMQELERQNKIARAQDRRLAEMERKVAFFTEQRLRFEEQADSQLSPGSGAKMAIRNTNDHGDDGGNPQTQSGSVAHGVFSQKEGGSCGSRCEVPAPRTDGKKVDLGCAQECFIQEDKGVCAGVLEGIAREKDFWESKVAGFRSSLVSDPRPTSGDVQGNAGSVIDSVVSLDGLAEVPVDNRNYDDDTVSSEFDSSDAVLPSDGSGESAASTATPGSAASTSTPTAHTQFEAYVDENGTGEGIIAAAMRSAGLEVSTAHEIAELLRHRPPKGDGQQRGDALRVSSSTGSNAARQWAARRMKQKRSGLRSTPGTPSRSVESSRVQTPLVDPDFGNGAAIPETIEDHPHPPDVLILDGVCPELEQN